MAEKRKWNHLEWYCFKCKGDKNLRFCEFEGCEKAYHIECMGKSLICGGHGEEPNNHLPNTKRERSTSQQALKKKEGKSKKREFIGWGSKPLIDFLESVGTDTSIEVSQLDVEFIVRRHVTANNLFTDEKKRKFTCDQKLTTLFGPKQVITKNIYKLLELHYHENAEFHEQDRRGFSSEEENENEDTCLAQGKQRKMGKSEKTEENKVVTKATRSCFASVVAENIKLVYLRKSVVMELSEELETFESMVLGSFVKVKSDPNDHRQKNRYQLVQITGVKNISPRGKKEEILLQASDRCTDFSISMLSEGDFSEEECEDLNQRVKSGQLPKLTIVDIEEQAKRLHIVITKDLIVKKLARLQNKMDNANEKGMRALFFQCSGEIQLLKTEAEQTRLLEEVPKVIAEELDIESVPDGANESLKLGDEIPLKSGDKSNFEDNSMPGNTGYSAADYGIKNKERDDVQMNIQVSETKEKSFGFALETFSSLDQQSIVPVSDSRFLENTILHQITFPCNYDLDSIMSFDLSIPPREKVGMLLADKEIAKMGTNLSKELEIESIPYSANQSFRLGDKIPLKSGDKSDFDDNFVSGNAGSSSANNGIKKKKRDEVQMDIEAPNIHGARRSQRTTRAPRHLAAFDTSG